MWRFLVVLIIVVTTGCASSGNKPEARLSMSDGGYRSAAEKGSVTAANRVLIQNAYMEIKSYEVAESLKLAAAAVADLEGTISNSQFDEENRTGYMNARIPTAKVDGFLDTVSTLGKVKTLSRSSRDVTVETAQAAAERENLMQLEKRLAELSASADGVIEVLEVEKELSRVRLEIARLEAAREIQQNEVDSTDVSLSVSQRRVLGPIGHVFSGGVWLIGKLFVIK